MVRGRRQGRRWSRSSLLLVLVDLGVGVRGGGDIFVLLNRSFEKIKN
jgi:hypothetical protein